MKFEIKIAEKYLKYYIPFALRGCMDQYEAVESYSEQKGAIVNYTKLYELLCNIGSYSYMKL